MTYSTKRRATWFLGALALAGCTSLTAVDWSLVDDATGGSGGASGGAGSGGSTDGMAGMDEGGAGSGEPAGGEAGEGGQASEGGAPMMTGGSAGSGGMSGGGGKAGAGGSSAGTAGAGGTSAGTAGTAGTAGSAGSAGAGGTGPTYVCGDSMGHTEELGGECEPPSSHFCSDDCVRVATQACYDCEQAGPCFEYSSSCVDNTDTPEKQKLCYDVQECVNRTNCGDGANTLTSCFCGALSTADCIAAPSSGAGAPAGLCATEIRKAMGDPATTTNAQVLTRYINIAFPGGAGLARLNCTKLAPTCSAACGF